jgi:hypothetical protein
MADEKVNTTADETSPPLGEGTPEAPLAEGVGAGPEGGPVPGDPSSEQVATAAQSHVKGRVGPPSIPQDAAATHHAPKDVEQIEPGTVLDASTPLEGGAIAYAVPDPATMGAGPYGGDTPADAEPNKISKTEPGTDLPGPDELPAGVPQASNTSAAGGPVTIPAGKTAGKDSATSGGSATAPTSPGDSPASSDSPGSAAGDTADPDDDAAGSAGTSDSDDSAASKSESTTTSKTTTRKR